MLLKSPFLYYFHSFSIHLINCPTNTDILLVKHICLLVSCLWCRLICRLIYFHSINYFVLILFYSFMVVLHGVYAWINNLKLDVLLFFSFYQLIIIYLLLLSLIYLRGAFLFQMRHASCVPFSSTGNTSDICFAKHYLCLVSLMWHIITLY